MMLNSIKSNDCCHENGSSSTASRMCCPNVQSNGSCHNMYLVDIVYILYPYFLFFFRGWKGHLGGEANKISYSLTLPPLPPHYPLTLSVSCFVLCICLRVSFSSFIINFFIFCLFCLDMEQTSTSDLAEADANVRNWKSNSDLHLAQQNLQYDPFHNFQRSVNKVRIQQENQF